MSKNKKPAYKMISLEQLNIYAAYQRHNGSVPKAASKHVKNIANNWDDALLDPLVVVCVGGDAYEVIDGGNRFLAAKLVKGVSRLPCRVVDVDGEESRALLFIQSNETRRAVSAYDMYRAGVIAKDAMSCKIKEIVEENDYAVARHQGSNKFTAIVALRSIIKANSVLASRAFEIAAGICDPYNISNKLLKGLFILLLDQRGLKPGDIDKLRIVGPKKIEKAIELEAYEAPKGCTSAKVYANGIRRALRRRRKTT